MHKPDNQHVLDIPLSQIRADPNQPRKDFSDVDRLVESMDELGQLQPILVTRLPDDSYRIVEGESRHRAAGILKWETIKCVIVEIDGKSRRDIQFAANMVRSELSPFELADEYHRILTEHSFTQAQLAKKVDVSEATVSSVLKLRAIPENIKTRLLPVCREAGTEALALVSRAKSSKAQEKMADLIVEGTPVSKLRKALKATKKKETSGATDSPAAVEDETTPQAKASDVTITDTKPSPDEHLVLRWWDTYTVHAVRTKELLDVLAGDLKLTSRALAVWLEENNDSIIAGYRIVTVSLAPTKVCYQLVPIGMDRSDYRDALTARQNEHKNKSMRSS